MKNQFKNDELLFFFCSFLLFVFIDLQSFSGRARVSLLSGDFQSEPKLLFHVYAF